MAKVIIASVILQIDIVGCVTVYEKHIKRQAT